MAIEWDAQLIVAGTHGRKGLNRFLMGSMAEDILEMQLCRCLLCQWINAKSSDLMASFYLPVSK